MTGTWFKAAVFGCALLLSAIVMLLASTEEPRAAALLGRRDRLVLVGMCIGFRRELRGIILRTELLGESVGGAGLGVVIEHLGFGLDDTG